MHVICLTCVIRCFLVCFSSINSLVCVSLMIRGYAVLMHLGPVIKAFRPVLLNDLYANTINIRLYNFFSYISFCNDYVQSSE